MSGAEVGGSERQSTFAYVCPICGYTSASRLKASSHLVNRHLICARKKAITRAGGEEGKYGHQWRKMPDIEELQKLLDDGAEEAGD